MASNGNGGWWRGSFPTWLVAVLIGLIGFFMQREITTNDHYRVDTGKVIVELQKDIVAIKTRLVILEELNRDNHQLLSELAKKIKF